MHEPDFFSHTPLEDPSVEIRLLSINSNTESSKNGRCIDCILFNHKIETAPEYIAVSYAWGAHDELETIAVNGRMLRVRRNCWYVLHQAHVQGISSQLWMDAVCIDHQDIREKSVQVGMMADIYRKAINVNVCLGPHGDNSQKLFVQMRKHARQLGEAGLKNLMARPKPGPGEATTEYMNDVGVLTWFESWREESPRIDHELGQLYRRPYFGRLWIVQEVFCAKHVMVLRGDLSISPRDMRAFQDNFGLWSTGVLDSFLIMSGWQTLPAVRTITDFWSRKQKINILQVEQELGQAVCFDPRDRNFGLLQVLEWDTMHAIEADYSKSTFELAHQLFVSGYLDITPARPGEAIMPLTRVRDMMIWLQIKADQYPVNEMLSSQRYNSTGQASVTCARVKEPTRKITCTVEYSAYLSTVEGSTSELSGPGVRRSRKPDDHEQQRRARGD